MRTLKSFPFLKSVNSYVIDAPTPSNLSYMWNFGSLLGLCLVIQIVTGVTLAMHYNPSVTEAFNSVEHIMRDVNNGWLIRYLHSNTASAFFFLVYFHIGRGLYYGSYKSPRTLVWVIGTVIFILMMATAFLGYVLPYGQMSLWGATVITNLMSAIPWIGQDIVEFIWGGFSVSNATLNRFFALHFLLPFVLAGLVLMHLIALHDSAGSGNPLGISANEDRIPFAPYYIFKDLITIFLVLYVLSLFIFFMPNILGDSENYVMANPMQTPPAIVPEWYLLPFYAILRSIPNKLFGVIAMFSAILIILAMPFVDLAKLRGIQFRPSNKTIFFGFSIAFLILMKLGAVHVEAPFIEFGQLCTYTYFIYFIGLIPVVSMFDYGLIYSNINKILNNIFEVIPKTNNFNVKISIFNIINPLNTQYIWILYFIILYTVYIYYNIDILYLAGEVRYIPDSGVDASVGLRLRDPSMPEAQSRRILDCLNRSKSAFMNSSHLWATKDNSQDHPTAPYVRLPKELYDPEYMGIYKFHVGKFGPFNCYYKWHDEPLHPRFQNIPSDSKYQVVKPENPEDKYKVAATLKKIEWYPSISQTPVKGEPSSSSAVSQTPVKGESSSSIAVSQTPVKGESSTSTAVSQIPVKTESSPSVGLSQIPAYTVSPGSVPILRIESNTSIVIIKADYLASQTPAKTGSLATNVAPVKQEPATTTSIPVKVEPTTSQVLKKIKVEEPRPLFTEYSVTPEPSPVKVKIEKED
jgi:ubiquinol-cytochrome c reductase cytochrome b subunit